MSIKRFSEAEFMAMLDLHEEYLAPDKQRVWDPVEKKLVIRQNKGKRLDLREFGVVDLRGFDFSRRKLAMAIMPDAIMDGVNMYNTWMPDIILDRASLNGANLDSVNLVKAEVYNASLIGASLRGARLMRADFDGSNLQRTNLSHSHLRRTSFVDADLSEAVLLRADLSWTIFYNTRLYGTDLESTLNSNLARVRGKIKVGSAERPREFLGEEALIWLQLAALGGERDL